MFNEIQKHHSVSEERPSRNVRPSSTHRDAEKRKMRYYPTPPLNGRTFSFFTQTEVGSSRVLGLDKKRKNLSVQNLSTQNVYLSVGTPASASGTEFSNAVLIPANAYFEFPSNSAPINDIFIVSAVAGAHVVIIETITAI